jgi:hypothetical protein
MLESRLVDLAFGELTADEKLRLLAEVESCADCLCVYHSMTKTLSVFDQSVAASLPEESYWPEHQAARRQRLEQFAPLAGTAKRESLLKRIFAARLPVPVPVAAAIALALLVSSVLALRPSTREAATVIQPPVVLAAPPKFVEVPVYHEKVVMRTVYVEKKMREKDEARRQAPPVQRNGARLTARHDEEESGQQGGFFTRANLTDFQPPDEMRIRVIKRSNSDEN